MLETGLTWVSRQGVCLADTGASRRVRPAMPVALQGAPRQPGTLGARQRRSPPRRWQPPGRLGCRRRGAFGGRAAACCAWRVSCNAWHEHGAQRPQLHALMRRTSSRAGGSGTVSCPLALPNPAVLSSQRPPLHTFPYILLHAVLQIKTCLAFSCCGLGKLCTQPLRSPRTPS